MSSTQSDIREELMKQTNQIKTCGACGAILNGNMCPLGHDPEHPTIPTKQAETIKEQSMNTQSDIREKIVVSGGRGYLHSYSSVNGFNYESITPLGNDPKIIANVAIKLNIPVTY